MSTISTFPGLVGFYVLTPDGQLGFFNQDNMFVVDAMLTKTFGDYNMRYLMAYLRNPEQGNFRLAIIHRTLEKRPWGSECLFLEKHIVRRLYPVTGMTTDVDLTSFQKKNREKSIYRGMELFLEYKDGSNPDVPIYCPVLYDRGTMLDDYASILDRQVISADRETPVVEVINLLAAIPVAKRNTTEIGILKEKIYHGSVKKGMRKSAEFTLIEDIRRNAENGKERNEGDLYGDVDKRSERQVTLDAGQGKTSAGSADDNLIRNIGSSLVGHPEPADMAALKTFTRFRGLDHEKLEAIVAQCLIYKVPPGTKLLERGTRDTWNLYLLEGTLQLTAADGGEKLIDGGTGNASNPVSSLKPRMYTVTAVTRAAFLWIDDKLIEKIVGEKPIPQRRDGLA
jgi:hypothetical protein